MNLLIKRFPDDLRDQLAKLAIDKGLPLRQVVINVLEGYVLISKAFPPPYSNLAKKEQGN